MASSLTRNQVPRKGLRVRVPCPPLGLETHCRGARVVRSRSLEVGCGFVLCAERSSIRDSCGFAQA